MKLHIEIDTKTFVRFWLVVIGFVFAIYLIYLSWAAIVILASSAFLALALSGPVGILSRHIPGKSRLLATAIAFLAVIISLGALLFIVAPPIAQQTIKLINNAPQLVQSFSSQWSGVADFIDKYQLQPQIDSALATIKADSTNWLSHLSSGVLSQVGSFVALLGAIVLTIVLSFLMLLEGPEWMKRIWRLYDDQETMEAHRKVVTRMHRVVTGYVTGQLTVSGIGALASGSAVFAISMFIEAIDTSLAPPAIAIAFLFSLIPMFGATIGGTLITLLLLVNSLPAAIIFAIFFIVYQQVENNFISPAIQSKYVELSPLTVLGSVTIGLYLFGLAGGIISIPIAGCVKVLLEDYLERSKTKREHSKQPIHKLMKKLQGED
ncbi:MAG TPA: AI-2E family transporter [Patescibacteria group bacterium]|jgi:predicted PurR-regulated permease PerM|nr:AI-2E family transporter [Patescibacteria group bacterium]